MIRIKRMIHYKTEHDKSYFINIFSIKPSTLLVIILLKNLQEMQNKVSLAKQCEFTKFQGDPRQHTCQVAANVKKKCTCTSHWKFAKWMLTIIMEKFVRATAADGFSYQAIHAKTAHIGWMHITNMMHSLAAGYESVGARRKRRGIRGLKNTCSLFMKRSAKPGGGRSSPSLWPVYAGV